MGRRTKEEAERTRETLLDAAEVLFLEQGVAATTLEEIARHAGVTRGAFYWHFNNKCELFNAMHDRVKMPMDALFERAMVDADPLHAMEELCIYALKNMATDLRRQRVYSIVNFKCEQVDALKNKGEWHQRKFAEAVKRCEKIFARAHKAGQLRPGITPKNAAHALHAYINGIFLDFLRNIETYDISKRAPMLVGIFFRGISAR